MPRTNTSGWLRDVLKPLAPVFREVLAMSLFVNLLAMAVPVFTMQVYDREVFHGGTGTLVGLVVGMAGVLAFDGILRQARARILQTVAVRVDVQVGRRLFDKLMTLPLATLENRPAAQWHALFRDVDVIRNTVSGASALLVCDLPFAVLFLAVTFVIAPPIVWVVLLILPMFLFVAWRSGREMTAVGDAERTSAVARDDLIGEIIAGRGTIKMLALERAMRPLWEDRHADTIERAAVRGSKADGYATLGTTLTMLTTVALTAVGAIAILNQQLTVGALIASNMLSGRLLEPLGQLIATWRAYSGFRRSVERLGQLFASESERQVSAIALNRPEGTITLERVTFTYGTDETPVIDNIDLTIVAGGLHVLIGRNGSGKSTLLKLIQGLYPPVKGRVLLDGADVAQFTRGELAGWMGYVPQECVLFAGTLRDNIRHRKPDATDDEVIRAATAAGAHPFIVDLPDGYASEVGEAGRRLSAGQRQRIAIARALIGNPSVLLLDEPSSGLDRQAEHELRGTLVNLGKERTVIIVTHSPSLLSACSHLIALDRGRIALTGPACEILPSLFGASRGSDPTAAAPPGQRSDEPPSPAVAPPAAGSPACEEAARPACSRTPPREAWA